MNCKNDDCLVLVLFELLGEHGEFYFQRGDMSDRIIIQCSGCSAKVAISDPSKLGKKIKCSKCGNIFMAKALSSDSAKASTPVKPTSKLNKSDEDEFNFDGMEMEDTSEADEPELEVPARPSKARRKKPVAAKDKSKGSDKKKPGGNLPMIIGGAAAIVLLIGSGIWLLMSDKHEAVPVDVQAAQEPNNADPQAAGVAKQPPQSIGATQASPGQSKQFTLTPPPIAGVFSPDGTILATADEGYVIRAWEADTGRLLSTRRLPDDWKFASPNGNKFHAQLFGISRDNRYLITDAVAVLDSDSAYLDLLIWDLHNERIVQTIRSSNSGPVSGGKTVISAAFSPDGRSVLVSRNDITALRIWDIETGQERTTHTDRKRVVGWHPPYYTFVAAGGGEQPENSKIDRALAIPYSGQVFFSPDGAYVAAFRSNTFSALICDFADGGNVKLWPIPKSQLEKDAIAAAYFTSNSEQLVVVKKDGETVFWNFLKDTFEAGSKLTVATMVSPTGTQAENAVVAETDPSRSTGQTEVKLINPTSGKVVRTIKLTVNGVLAWSPRADKSLGRNGQLEVHPRTEGIPLTAPNLKVMEDASAKQLLLPAFQNVVQRPAAIPEKVPVVSLLASPDGKAIVATYGNRLILFDTATWSSRRLQASWPLQFTSDSRSLVAFGESLDQKSQFPIGIYDVETGTQTGAFPHPLPAKLSPISSREVCDLEVKNILCYTDSSNTLTLFDTENGSGRLWQPFSGNLSGGDLWFGRMSPTGKTVMALTPGQKVALAQTNLLSKTEVHPLGAMQDNPFIRATGSLSFSRDGRMLALVNGGNFPALNVIMLSEETAKGEWSDRVRLEDGSTYAVGFSRDSSTVFVNGPVGLVVVKLNEARLGNQLEVLGFASVRLEKGFAITALECLPDGRIICGHIDGSFSIWGSRPMQK